MKRITFIQVVFLIFICYFLFYINPLGLPKRALSPKSPEGNSYRNEVRGKWKILNGRGAEKYFLLHKDRTVEEVDKNSYDRARAVKPLPETKAVQGKGFMSPEDYFKYLEYLTSQDEADLEPEN